MFCPYCKVARVENEAACPNCGAPSPLQGGSQNDRWGTAGSSQAMWDNSSASPNISTNVVWDQVPQVPFDAPSMPVWTQPQAQDQQYWSQIQEASPSWSSAVPPQHSPVAQPAQDQQRSLVPVPYQGQMAAQPTQYTVPLQLVPEQALEHLLPAEPEQVDTVYVPPMYTQPRAIIPKYRVISGLISFTLVVLLLCGGATYYAKASGTLNRIFNSGPPPTIKMAQQNLPDPPNQTDKDRGPAYNVIPSATTASRVDQQGFAVQEVRSFKAGQTFYLTFSVHAPGDTDGKVITKWYTDQKYFTTVASKGVVPAGKTNNGFIQMIYQQPAEGWVELYWSAKGKDQLAQRVYFVVRP